MAITKKIAPRVPRYSTKQIIQAIDAAGGMVYLAARTLGCAPATIYKRMNRNPDIDQVIKDKRGEFIDVAESALKRAVLAGEAWAVCFTLKTVGRDRGYVERREVEEVTTEKKVHEFQQQKKILRASVYADDTEVDEDS